MTKPSPLLNQTPSKKMTAYMIIALGVVMLITIIPMLLLPFVIPALWAAKDVVIFVSSISFFVGLSLIILFLGRFMLRKAIVLEQREAKRQRIIEDSAIEFLTQSPVTQPMLTLPLTVRLRARLWFKIFTSLLAILCLGLLVLEILGGAPLLTIIGAVVAGSSVIIPALLAFGPMGLIVNDEGISQKTPLGILSKMKWQNVRTVALAGPRTHTLPVEFEVTDNRTFIVVSWWRLPPKGFAQRFGYLPPLPTEAYNQQIDAVLAYVLERTGLPLHDIRDD